MFSAGRRMALAAATLALGGTAHAQWLWDSFDGYEARPAGEPLTGQGGWTLPAGRAAADSALYTFSGNPFGLEQPFGSTQFAAGIGPGIVGGEPAVAAARHPMSPTGNYLRLTARVAVLFTSRPPAGEEIGRISLEPLGESASAAVVARWADGTAEAWNADLLWYDEMGVAHITQVPNPGFQSLRPGVWYDWSLRVELHENRIDGVSISEVSEWRGASWSSPDWYLAGGAAGGLPEPDAVGLSAGEPGAIGSVLAIDLLRDASYWCYNDCDQSGELDFFDFLCFQNRFAAGDPWADCDASGRMDWFDFLCFQNEFHGGCGP